MQQAVCGQNPTVFCESSSLGKIKRLAIQIRDLAACFLANDRPCGLVPNFFFIIWCFGRDQTEQRITAAMGTSLMNDMGYAYDIQSNLITVGSTMFASSAHELDAAQRLISLSDDELHQAVADSTPPPDANHDHRQ